MTENFNPELENKFDELFEKDKQLQFSLNAIRNYKKNNYQEETKDYNAKGGILGHSNVTSGLQNNMKRHIVNIDDISRINYEMIKNSPGNFFTLPSSLANIKDTDFDTYSEIDSLKAKYYKNRLFKLNDQFKSLVNKNMNESLQKNISDSSTQPIKNNVSTSQLKEQIDCLYKIQENLMADYQKNQNMEKKWFIMKELLIDSNVELDLYSQQEKIAVKTYVQPMDDSRRDRNTKHLKGRSKRVANKEDGNSKSNVTPEYRIEKFKLGSKGKRPALSLHRPRT